MSNIHIIDANFQTMEISFFSEKNALLGTVRHFDPVKFWEQYAEIIKNFMESIKGKKINIYLPQSQKVSNSNKSYGNGSLFMDRSCAEVY